MDITFIPPFGATKSAEYQRSAELFIEICNTKKAYFAISFLSDSGYNNADLREIQKIVHQIQFKRNQAELHRGA